MDDETILVERVLARIVQAMRGELVPGAITADLRLRADLGLDSLGLWALVFELARALGRDPDFLVELLADQPLDTVASLLALSRRCAAVPHPI
jgi:acyl carrier protein